MSYKLQEGTVDILKEMLGTKEYIKWNFSINNMGYLEFYRKDYPTEDFQWSGNLNNEKERSYLLSVINNFNSKKGEYIDNQNIYIIVVRYKGYSNGEPFHTHWESKKKVYMTKESAVEAMKQMRNYYDSNMYEFDILSAKLNIAKLNQLTLL